MTLNLESFFSSYDSYVVSVSVFICILIFFSYINAIYITLYNQSLQLIF